MKNKEILGSWRGKRYDYQDKERKTFKFLVDRLSSLKKQYNILGIKQSFEDEGAILDDVLTMRRITELAGVSLYVKIGGCEAITDINHCASIGVDTVIAPMVESPFALSKFINAVKNINSLNCMFVCETKTAAQNLDDMLSKEEAKRLSGIVVGRSDFTKSFSLPKDNVDSEFINKEVRKCLITAKQHNLVTTMGGNISVSSVDFVKEMFDNKLLDKIETRNIVIGLNDQNINCLDDTIKAALNYEIEWLCFKAQNYNSIGSSFQDRAEVLQGRI